MTQFILSNMNFKMLEVFENVHVIECFHGFNKE